MRVATIALSFALISPNPLPADPHLHRTPPQQAAATSSPTAPTLQQSLATLVGNASLTDVTLTGSVRRIAGSDDESGTSALEALTTGESRMDLSLPSGPHTEVVAIGNNCLSGNWSGPDGVAHPISNHNLLTDTAWFFPVFTVGRIISSGKYIVSYVGHETRNGQAVEHFIAYQPSTVQLPAGIPTFSHLTQMDLFLDSITLMPAALAFNIHPDNNMGLDIPVEIRFSDYRSVSGVQIPFHIEKFVNNSLMLDFQAQTVAINTGLTSSTFSAQ